LHLQVLFIFPLLFWQWATLNGLSLFSFWNFEDVLIVGTHVEIFCIYIFFWKDTQIYTMPKYKSFTITPVLHGFKWIYTILHLPIQSSNFSFTLTWKVFLQPYTCPTLHCPKPTRKEGACGMKSNTIGQKEM